MNTQTSCQPNLGQTLDGHSTLRSRRRHRYIRLSCEGCGLSECVDLALESSWWALDDLSVLPSGPAGDTSGSTVIKALGPSLTPVDSDAVLSLLQPASREGRKFPIGYTKLRAQIAKNAFCRQSYSSHRNLLDLLRSRYRIEADARAVEETYRQVRQQTRSGKQQ
jgi:hypothetical protein